MKKIIIFFMFWNTVFVFAFDFNGDFTFHESWFINDYEFHKNPDNFHEINLIDRQELNHIDLKLSSKLKLYDYQGNPYSSDLLQLWESWIQINDIGFQGLTLKIGKQFFEWGTADSIHPSSVINPDDWSDSFALDEKVPVSAVNLNYTFNFIQFYVIWIPSFRNAILPKYFKMYNDEQLSVPGMTVCSVTETELRPASDKLYEQAAKINFSFPAVDFSFGFFSGYDFIRQIQTLQYTPVSLTQADLHITYYYPELEVYTADFSTSLFGIGFWGEAGLYNYKKEYLNIIVSGITNKETAFDGKPYASYVFGADYNFVNGWYFNMQYSYGIPYVRGWRNFEDYILTDLKIPIGNFVNINLTGLFGFKRNEDIGKNYEYMLGQQCDYDFSDNLSFSCSVSEINACGSMMFKDWSDFNSFNVEVKYSF